MRIEGKRLADFRHGFQGQVAAKVCPAQKQVPPGIPRLEPNKVLQRGDRLRIAALAQLEEPEIEIGF